MDIRDFINANILSNQTSLVEFLLEKQPDLRDDIVYAPKDNEEEEEVCNYPKIHQWFLVEHYLANLLQAKGEPILECEYGTWWGRMHCGYALEDEEVIKEIYESI